MSPILGLILSTLKVAAPMLPIPGAGEIPAAIDAIPDIETAVKDAMVKAGYTNAQIDAIFADVLPLDQLGIVPGHPVAPEPAQADIRSAPHITAAPRPPAPPEPTQPAALVATSTQQPAPALTDPWIFAR